MSSNKGRISADMTVANRPHGDSLQIPGLESRFPNLQRSHSGSRIDALRQYENLDYSKANPIGQYASMNNLDSQSEAGSRPAVDRNSKPDHAHATHHSATTTATTQPSSTKGSSGGSKQASLMKSSGIDLPEVPRKGYENHGIRLPRPSSSEDGTGALNLSRGIKGLSLSFHDGPQVPIVFNPLPGLHSPPTLPSSLADSCSSFSPPPSSSRSASTLPQEYLHLDVGVLARKALLPVQAELDVQALRKALQAAKESWEAKTAYLEELIEKNAKELKTLQLERLSISEERARHAATTRKKDQEISQLKTKVILSVPDSPGELPAPDLTSKLSLLDEDDQVFSQSLPGSLPKAFKFSPTLLSSPSLEGEALPVLSNLLAQKQGVASECSEKLGELVEEAESIENKLLQHRDDLEGMFNSPYLKMKDDLKRLETTKAKVSELEAKLLEKNTVISEESNNLQRLEEFCECLQKSVSYLEEFEVDSKAKTEHYWNVHDSLEHIRIENAKWYWGAVSKEDTYEILSSKPSGQFLVRDSTSQPGNYVLCVRVNIGNSKGEKINDVLMIHVKNIGGQYGFFRSKSQFSSVSELVSYYSQHPLVELNPLLTTTLKAPASRMSSFPRHRTMMKSPVSMDSPVLSLKNLSLYGDDSGTKRNSVVEIEDLIDHLADLTPHWEVIGYALGVSDVVKSLRGSEKDPRNKCLLMLEEWLERGKDNTWAKLFDVLRKNQMNSTISKLRSYSLQH